MKIITHAILVLIAISSSVHSNAASLTYGNNFTMIAAGGGTLIGGTNDVQFTWDRTLNYAVSGAVSNATLSSDEAFFGSIWDAHDVTIYGEGTYTIYDGCDAGDAGCGVGNAVTFTVGPNQIGGHILFDWPADSDPNTLPHNVNIDVINVWDQQTTWSAIYSDGLTNPFYTGSDNGDSCTSSINPSLPCVIDGSPNTATTLFQLVSTDWDGDGIAGGAMTDGVFIDSNANFNLRVVPIPASAWLFGSGLLALIGIPRRTMEA